MLYASFIFCLNMLASQHRASFFYEGCTIDVIQTKNRWCIQTPIMVADAWECKAALDEVPIGDKLALETIRASLQYSKQCDALVLMMDVAPTSRFLRFREVIKGFVELSVFWKNRVCSHAL